jgi:hypothetical protein
VSLHHFKKYIRLASQALQSPVLAAGCQEAQSSGWPHWHALVACAEPDAAQFAHLSSLWFQPHGYAKLYRVRENAALPIAGYITKYLLKADHAVEFAQAPGESWAGIQWTLKRNNR